MDEELLLEAIYILDKYCELEETPNSRLLQINSKLPFNILNATLRILTANKLMINEKNKYYITENNLIKLEDLKTQIKESKIPEDMIDLLEKLETKIKNPFFKDISDLEYEIYSRCNFSICLFLGEALSKVCDFSNSSILDIGGNSGGIGTAIINYYPDSNITIIDKKIPCNIGNEYREINKIRNIKFIEGDFFLLDLKKSYDYIILSNILHDYNDEDCKRILEVCKNHSQKNTKILILEDILHSELEPINVLEHGLRLSINTLYGQQRTTDELNALMKTINMNMIKKEPINEIQSVIVYQNL